jgi:hypothetical protein
MIACQKLSIRNNPLILTAAPGEDGNETMLGRVVEAYNVKTRQ